MSNVKTQNHILKLKDFWVLFFWLLLLTLRFLFELNLASKFEPGVLLKLDFCLVNEPYQQGGNQVFYYQNHFQRIMVSVLPATRIDFGDCLAVAGTIVRGDKGLYLDNPKVVVSEKESPVKFFYTLKNSLSRKFLQVLPYPEADLATGIVLGDKKQIDHNLTEKLRSVGILHIAVASGYNLSLLGERPVSVLSYFIGRKLSLLIGFLLVWFYVALVGFEPPVVRAGIMVSCLFLAQTFGKKFSSERALMTAVFAMLFLKPDLIVSISFQLSVAAFYGIVTGKKIFANLAKIPYVGQVLAETLSAQIMVAPLIAYHFGRTSILAPFANILVLPVIPFIMNLGLIAVSLAWLPLIGGLLSWLMFPALFWIVFTVGNLAKLPFAELALKINWWETIMTYLLIFFIYRKVKTKGEK